MDQEQWGEEFYEGMLSSFRLMEMFDAEQVHMALGIGKVLSIGIQKSRHVVQLDGKCTIKLRLSPENVKGEGSAIPH